MNVADLHIHSKYSRATSRDCDAPHLDLWARYKGINLVGMGDFTHPMWREELKEALQPAEDGLYRLKDAMTLPYRIAGEVTAPRFVVSGEISTIYKRGGKTRKVHHVILLPSLEAARELSHRLEAIGNLHSDGRPILGLDSHDLLEITLESCPEAIYIPAHIWTPHFSLFGAFSGFDSLEECYGDLTQYVHAVETGLSSDPTMNRCVSALDGCLLVSNSDAHSPSKLGREATLLEGELSYPSLRRALQTGDGLYGTIEFFPEEGKYHLDGHRACNCCLEPAQTIRLNGRCPVCGRKLTIGVLHRVEELADRARDDRREADKPFESLIPLVELLGNCMGVSSASKRVQQAYFDLLGQVGTELHILREAPLAEMEKTAGFEVAEGLRRLRAGRVLRQSGYDGEYGVISLFEPHELEMLAGQTTLLSLRERTETAARTKLRSSEKTKKASGSKEPPKTGGETLNPLQQMAVESNDPVLAVIAGPGTGKTKTLVARIAYLIETKGVSPAEMTAVTFTNQAATEMRQRLEERLGGKKAVRGLTVGTFHAICLQLIVQKPMITQAQARDVVSALIRERGERLSAGNALQLISQAKVSGTGCASGLPSGLLEAYIERLRELEIRDLDDVLLDALLVDVQKKRMFSHLLVDEFQDMNGIQHELVRHWSEHGSSLFVIGDPDQAIYGFRGANAMCFEALAAYRPKTRLIALEQNYRSTPEILACGLSVIAKNGGRQRVLLPNCPHGASARVVGAPDVFSEGIWIAKEIAGMVGGVDMLDAQAAGNDRAATRSFSEIAVLCRTRRQLEQMEACLRHDSIPCIVTGREDFLNEPLVEGMLGFFRSLIDPRDSASLRLALSALWRCPATLSQRAETVLAGMATPTLAALTEALSEFEPLRPWLAAVDICLPMIAVEKPRALLERLSGLISGKGASVQKLLNMSVFSDSMSALLRLIATGEEADLRRLSGTGYASGAVRLMTLHGSKGLEFPVVFLAGASAGIMPLEHEGRTADLEEERRLFFVGITRAREELIVSYGGEPSAFLDELPAQLRRQVARGRKRIPDAEQLSLF